MSASADAGECTRSATAPDRADQRVLVDPEVRPHRRRAGVGGEHQQRRAALGRLGDAGHRVGQPAALVHRQHADPAAHPGVGVGHRRRAALVPGGDERDAARAQRVGDVEVAAADHTERVADAELGERPADQLGDVSGASPGIEPSPTSASTRAGLPDPPTIGSGPAITTAPVARQPGQVPQLGQPVLARRRAGRSGTGTAGRTRVRAPASVPTVSTPTPSTGDSSASQRAHSTEMPGCAGPSHPRSGRRRGPRCGRPSRCGRAASRRRAAGRVRSSQARTCSTSSRKSGSAALCVGEVQHHGRGDEPRPAPPARRPHRPCPSPSAPARRSGCRCARTVRMSFQYQAGPRSS